MSIPAYDPDNIFTKILAGDLPCHKVYEDEQTFAFMDIMPRSKGHCLVIPKNGARNMLDANPQDLAALMVSVQKVSRAAMAALDAQGITLLLANEPAANQEVFHLHFHIIPRYAGHRMDPPASVRPEQDELAATAALIRARL
jgi:histidine triad (HIT) family protein